MTNQGSLFTITYDQPQAATEAPICTLCRLHPARWFNTRNEYSRYCNGANCLSATRLCHICDQPFSPGAKGAGRKYCSEECKTKGYSVGFKRNPTKTPVPCRFCGEPTRAHICKACIREIPWADTLRKHNAPEWVWDHMTNVGTCMNTGCREDLTGRTKRSDSGAYVTQAHVDHDHTCCEHSLSCGKCVRGVLCQHCNRALGMLRNNLATITGLGTYLDMASVKT